MCRSLWIVLLCFVAPLTAHAGLLLEPYGGYSVGNVAIQTSPTFPVSSMQSYSDSGSINGFAYGGRAGFIMHHFVILAG